MLNDIEKFSVLIIDPSPHMGSLIAQMLRALKLRAIQECSDAKSAVRLCAGRGFDVVIIADKLGTLTGAEFVRTLRSQVDCPNREVAVIMTASAPDAAEIAAARDAGITEFLRKPFAAEHLKTRLVSIAARPRGFVTSSDYAGPDRRRKASGPRGDERRAATETDAG